MSGKGKQDRKKDEKKKKLSGHDYAKIRDEKNRSEIAKKMPKITSIFKNAISEC